MHACKVTNNSFAEHSMRTASVSISTEMSSVAAYTANMYYANVFFPSYTSYRPVVPINKKDLACSRYRQ